MTDTVVDSSVAAKWILPEPDSEQADRLISEVAQQGDRLRRWILYQRIREQGRPTGNCERRVPIL